MPTVDTETLLSRIRSGPRGSQIAAFFDFDGTIIQGYSSALLYEQRFKRMEVSVGEAFRLFQFTRGEPTEEDFRQLTTDGIQGWAGKDQEFLDQVGKDLWRNGIAKALFHEAWRLVKAHQRMGHTVVIASSATSVQISHLAQELGISDVLCTQLEMKDGLVTGQLTGRPLWGPGKEARIREFAAERGIDLAASFAYGNGDEDVPYLSAVGHPVAVNPQSELRTEAKKRNWPVVEFEGGPGRFDLVPQLRVGGLWAALAGAGSAGVAISLLTRDRWRGINSTISAFTQVASALADVKVAVMQGREHLHSHRPAVFLINHQSDMLDLFVCGSLLREDVTGMAKKEAASMPILGQIVNYTQFALVDRGDPAQAREALAHAVGRIHEGISIVVAPEGTRSASPSVGRFKKGGFHLAHQAEVPIVPIVIRNSGQLMTPASRSVRSGVIEVIVHPPISTEGWTKADIDRTAKEVHQFYVDTLEAWPGNTRITPVGSRPSAPAEPRATTSAEAPESAAPAPKPVQPPEPAAPAPAKAKAKEPDAPAQAPAPAEAPEPESAAVAPEPTVAGASSAVDSTPVAPATDEVATAPPDTDDTAAPPPDGPTDDPDEADAAPAVPAPKKSASATATVAATKAARKRPVEPKAAGSTGKRTAQTTAAATGGVTAQPTRTKATRAAAKSTSAPVTATPAKATASARKPAVKAAAKTSADPAGGTKAATDSATNAKTKPTARRKRTASTTAAPAGTSPAAPSTAAATSSQQAADTATPSAGT